MGSKLTSLPAWNALKEHQAKMRATRLNDLFAANATRADRFTIWLQGLCVDFSRTHVTDETLELLTKLAEAQNLELWRTRMFRGDRINNTEDRAVLHTALRSDYNTPIKVDIHDVMPDIKALHERMASFVDEVREKRWLGATGKPIRNIVNIGIGGSDLGARLTVGALRAYTSGPEVHFVANIDAADLLGLLPRLDPATTLFVIVSKTFTTQETLRNAQTAREWLVGQLKEEAVAKHFVAVSTNKEAATAFGIAESNIFPLWDWVGGRFCLWSAAGLSIALACGWKNFRDLLAGAALMDEHFRTTPFERNLPVLMGLIGLWYRNFWNTRCHVILPYAERLRELPRYLQQLEMESNGKSVTRDGEAVNYATAPALFGECGTISQHSFHQWLHQGTDLAPADFIGIRQDDLHQPEHHRALLANLKAQAEALQQGRQEKDLRRTNRGNKPSTLIWLDALDPQHLGMLLALYEHKVFVQGILWEINSFDQFGVELGKKLAAEALKDA